MLVKGVTGEYRRADLLARRNRKCELRNMGKTITHPCPWRSHNTVYPKKYAHGFVVLCLVVVMQSFIMNSNEVFIHIHQGCFAGTGAIVRLPQCQWSKPDGYGKISQCITTTKHRKAKTVCIFLGMYCINAINKFQQSCGLIICYIPDMHSTRMYMADFCDMTFLFSICLISQPFLFQYRSVILTIGHICNEFYSTKRQSLQGRVRIHGHCANLVLPLFLRKSPIWKYPLPYKVLTGFLPLKWGMWWCGHNMR